MSRATLAEPTQEPKASARAAAKPGPSLPGAVRLVVKFFSSLRLTVVLLSLSVALVFIGTIAQTGEGLYSAQNRYFRSLMIFWSPGGSGLKVPVFPGGYLLGGALLFDLLAAHAQ